MYSPPAFLEAVESQLGGKPEIHVYAGYSPGGSLLLRWAKQDGRILFRASDSSKLVGRQWILETIERLRRFKGHPIGTWVFVARGFRPNVAHVLEEHPVVLVQIDDETGLAALRGSRNLEPEFLRLLTQAVAKRGFSIASNPTPVQIASNPTPVQIGQQTREANPQSEKLIEPEAHSTAFVSYSWESDAHALWVLKLAADLIRKGVKVIIDKWDLPEHGYDLHRFMETGIRDSKFVIMVCTPEYARRANERRGGVGVESTIITGEFYDSDKALKFIPIVRRPGATAADSVPSFSRSKLFIDFSDDERYNERLEDLLYHIGERPRYRKPELGKFPELKSDEI